MAKVELRLSDTAVYEDPANERMAVESVIRALLGNGLVVKFLTDEERAKVSVEVGDQFHDPSMRLGNDITLTVQFHENGSGPCC